MDQMSPSILKIPPEILFQICRDIQGPLDDAAIRPDNKSLARLARTCKSFAAVVQPVLYRHLSSRWTLWGRGKPTLVPSLLHSAAKRGSPGELARYADIDSLVYNLGPVPIYGPPLPPATLVDGVVRWDDELFHSLGKYLKTGGIPDAGQRFRSHQKPGDDILVRGVIVLLLLAALPYLVKCRLPIFTLKGSDIGRGSLRERRPFPSSTIACRDDAGATTPAFPLLRELELLCYIWYDDQVEQLDCITYILENCPNLSSLRLEDFSHFPDTLDLSKLHLTSLSFIASLDFERISQLVSSCPRLQKLEISYEMAFGHHTLRASIPHMLIELARSPSASTLRTLRLGTCILSRPEPDAVSDTSVAASLSRFTSLKSISVAEQALFHHGPGDPTTMTDGVHHSGSALLDLVKYLPAVETLTIWDLEPQHRVEDALRYLASNISSTIPSPQLKRVKLFYIGTGGPGSAEQSLIEMFSSQNILLQVFSEIRYSSVDLYWRRMPFTHTNPLWAD